MKNTLSRRHVLKGLLATGGAVAVPLPTLDIMLNGNGTAFAQGAAIPVRYLTWFFGNGVLPGMFIPEATGSNWQLSPELMPLAHVKEYLTVVSGYGSLVDAGTHWGGAAAATVGGFLPGTTTPGGPSIDQVVADITSAGMPFRSLEVGVTAATPNEDGAITLHAVSHRGPGAPLRPEYAPKVVFDRLFSQMAPGGTSTPQASPLLGVKRSVLDSVLADGAALRGRLGMADQQRLESHLEGIRAIESRLVAPVQLACGSPTRPTVDADENEEATPAVNTAMTDLMILALSCGLTNVGSYVFMLPAAHVYFRGLGADMNADYHDTICHEDPGGHTGPDIQTRVHKGVLFTMESLAEMLVKMQGISVGGGNLLDYSLIYSSTDTAWGKTHQMTDFPVMLIGKAGGKLTGNQHLRHPGSNMSQVLLSIANIMGSPVTSFGSDVALATTGVPGLTT
ncbi:MAG: DUF1552 domain-containing protein [Polyangiaceae bacterium]|nr:DUF1552 domain-containing protein [Polyangiaceae bacterium]